MSLHLQREIDLLKKKILVLGALVEETVLLAAKAIRERDESLAQTLIDGDTIIDQREVDIEEECQKILALHQPVAHDLRFIIAVLKINAELERIGDSSGNIAKRIMLAKDQLPGFSAELEAMVFKAQHMLHRGLDALVNLNAALAYEVIASDEEIDRFNRSMYEKMEACILRAPENARAYIAVGGVSHAIERIADHASNIAEDVIYLVEGAIIRHHHGDQFPNPQAQ